MRKWRDALSCVPRAHIFHRKFWSHLWISQKEWKFSGGLGLSFLFFKILIIHIEKECHEVLKIILWNTNAPLDKLNPSFPILICFPYHILFSSSTTPIRYYYQNCKLFVFLFHTLLIWNSFCCFDMNIFSLSIHTIMFNWIYSGDFILHLLHRQKRHKNKCSKKQTKLSL